MKKTIKLLLLCLSIFLISTPVNAFVLTYNREYTKNLGVNKKWIINENNRKNVLDTPLVDSEEKIYDFSNILTNGEIETLRNNIEKFVDKTNMDMVILTINEPYSYDSKNEDIAADFYDYNDFGLNFEKYSGIILVRNINSYNRFFNIYTFGNAQLYYDYYTCEDILDEIYDDLKNDRYLDGFNTFISSATQYYSKGSNPDYYVDDDGYIHKNPPTYNPPIWIAFYTSVLVTLVTMIILIKKNKMVKSETHASEYIDRGSIKYNKQIDKFLHSHTSSYTVSSGGGSGSGGGGFSHSGSSGGGHGGGGGRHG